MVSLKKIFLILLLSWITPRHTQTCNTSIGSWDDLSSLILCKVKSHNQNSVLDKWIKIDRLSLTKTISIEYVCHNPVKINIEEPNIDDIKCLVQNLGVSVFRVMAKVCTSIIGIMFDLQATPNIPMSGLAIPTNKEGCNCISEIKCPDVKLECACKPEQTCNNECKPEQTCHNECKPENKCPEIRCPDIKCPDCECSKYSPDTWYSPGYPNNYQYNN